MQAERETQTELCGRVRELFELDAESPFKPQYLSILPQDQIELHVRALVGEEFLLIVKPTVGKYVYYQVTSTEVLPFDITRSEQLDDQTTNSLLVYLDTIVNIAEASLHRLEPLTAVIQ